MIVELRLLDSVVVKKRRGPGWVAGEVRKRKRGGKEGEQVVRPKYSVSPATAVEDALRIARGLASGTRQEGEARAILEAVAGSSAASAAEAMAAGAARLRVARLASGLSVRELARRAGMNRSTIWRIEHGHATPKTDTMARLFAACEPEIGRNGHD